MTEQAHRDSLTGFFAREALQPFLAELIKEGQATNKFFSIALLDLDHFKRYNDKHGHAFGDEILKYATSTLRLTFFESQCQFYRYGGDEFIAIFPEKDAKETFGLLRQCHYNLRHRPCLYENKFYRVTMSCGVASFPDDATSTEELIQIADEAMYFSKRTGRNSTTLVSKIPLLKIRNALRLMGIVASILLGLALAYHLGFKKIIKPTLGQIRHMKIVTKPEGLDTITLKSGVVFEGQIISETTAGITVNIYFDKGEGLTTFNKSEIVSIKRSP
ncbi:MAG: GGDEF domain-containing protein, partial [Candidatus Omnitrophota bacterium]